ncbi:hypothetical protein N865_17025 [Intrasporangium oryzae NRRL B-24470]|uniref:Glycosyltransferase RgtA/B/C/D-like domain-containing protein n=1 Tax=Intrasporangium oryzae NRRL B-24470 TaxID=1386089 RepID=W9GB49_9MICO|nr:hypothetical protein [Intrasporangium oryzae]EWT03431.1 hypothetical protein N865_17025 [Intrasporangium oryzae NRRL B-24470]
MESPVSRSVLRLAGAGLVAVALVALVAPRPANIHYRWPVVLPTVAVLLGLAALVRVPAALKNRWLPVVVAVVGGAVATALGQVLRYDYGWDARVVMNIARALHAGRPLTPDVYDYLSLYPNNIPLLAIDRLGADVGGWLGVAPDAVLITLTGVCVAVTLYAAHLVVVPVAGRGPALLTQLAVLALVGASPWLSVPYTDLYAMPFVIGGIALVLAALRRPGVASKAALGAAGVVCVGIAFAIKTTPAVVAAALALVALLGLVSTGDAGAGRRVRRVVPVIAAVIAGAALFAAVGLAVPAAASVVSGIDSGRIRPDASPPVTWWVASGLSEQTVPGGVTSYGTYRRDMVEAIEGRTPSEMTDYARRYIADRLAERGPAGTIAFYANKAAWNWGDGMFWAWGEGPDSLPGAVRVTGPVAGAVESVNGFDGEHYQLRADLTQGLWLTVLLVAGLGLLRARPRVEILTLALTVLGIAAFTLVFQGRSRYLFTFVPVVVALAACVHSALPWRRRPGGRRRSPSTASAPSAPLTEGVPS